MRRLKRQDFERALRGRREGRGYFSFRGKRTESSPQKVALRSLVATTTFVLSNTGLRNLRIISHIFENLRVVSIGSSTG
jgi:hypothetical protein